MRHIFRQIIDYAGLFPPASESMGQAVSNYAFYRMDSDHDLLGRFVVGASRLGEFSRAVEAVDPRMHGPHPFEVSMVIGPDLDAELGHILRALQGARTPFNTVAAEFKVNHPDEIRLISTRLPPRWERFVEVPTSGSFDHIIGEIGEQGFKAKLRTGGVVPGAFPPPEVVARFLRAVVHHNVPFKATAGLHHVLSGTYPLTYDTQSRSHLMYGYLSVIIALALVIDGEPEEVVVRALHDLNRDVIDRRRATLTWREHRFDTEHLEKVRDLFFSFGSCSFVEPVHELNLPWSR